MKRARPENSRISSYFSSTVQRGIPRMAAFKKMFSRPVRSGWNPAPSSRRLETWPRTSARPVVGTIVRARIERSVVLPEPLGPMIPRISPCSTAKSTSFRAQKSSRRSRRIIRSMTEDFSDRPPLWRSRNFFDRL